MRCTPKHDIVGAFVVGSLCTLGVLYFSEELLFPFPQYAPRPPLEFRNYSMRFRPPMRLLPVLIYSKINAALGRMPHPEWWPAEDRFRPFVYRIHDTWIESFDKVSIARPLITKADPERKLQVQQNSDVRTVLSHFSSTSCASFTYFLLVEDDIQPCGGSAQDFAALIEWLRHNTDHWGMVRVGVGLTGVILKCTHLPSFLAHPWRATDARAIDWAIGHFYREYPDVFGREIVMRHALVNHVPGPSNIWSHDRTKDRDENEVARCYKPIWWEGGSELSNFDASTCSAYQFSPCDVPALQRAPFRDRV